MFRQKGQLYIWWNSETPGALFKELFHSGASMQLYDKNFFNWTMTYRLSADVVWGYGYREDLLWNLPLGKKAVDELIAGKSNCAVSIYLNLVQENC